MVVRRPAPRARRRPAPRRRRRRARSATERRRGRAPRRRRRSSTPRWWSSASAWSPNDGVARRVGPHHRRRRRVRRDPRGGSRRRRRRRHRPVPEPRASASSCGSSTGRTPSRWARPAGRACSWPTAPAEPEVYDPVPCFWSDQYDRKIQLAGRSGARRRGRGRARLDRRAPVRRALRPPGPGRRRARHEPTPPRDAAPGARRRRRRAGTTGSSVPGRSDDRPDPGRRARRRRRRRRGRDGHRHPRRGPRRNLLHRSVFVVVLDGADHVVVHQRADWKDIWPEPLGRRLRRRGRRRRGTGGRPRRGSWPRRPGSTPPLGYLGEGATRTTRCGRWPRSTWPAATARSRSPTARSPRRPGCPSPSSRLARRPRGRPRQPRHRATADLRHHRSLLFYGSDAPIAWNRFMHPPLRSSIIMMVTYHLGQIGLVLFLV